MKKIILVLVALISLCGPSYAGFGDCGFGDCRSLNITEKGLNVGIGSPSPVSKLDVTGTVTATAFSGDGSALTNVPSTSEWTRNAPYIFPTTLTDNVGIGTRTPGSSLTILKNSTNDYMHINSTAAAGGNVFLVNNSGNIGIGTILPLSQLDQVATDNGTTVTAASAAMHSITNLSTTNNSFGDTAFCQKNASGALVCTSKIAGVQTSHTAAAESGDLVFVTDNAGTVSEKMRLTSAGNLGIGTFTAPAVVTLENTAGNNLINFNRSGTNYANFNMSSNNLNLGLGGGASFNVNAGNVGIGTTLANSAAGNNNLIVMGNVGIGTWVPGQALQINGSISGGANKYLISSTTYGTNNNQSVTLNGQNVNLNANVNTAVISLINSSEKMRVDSTGNVGIGSTNPGVLLDVNGGTFRVSGLASDSGATDATVCAKTTDGLFLKGSGTLGICLGTSTKEAKTNIEPIPAGLPDLLKLYPVRFNYKPGWGYPPEKPYYGFLAEDVDQVLPMLVGHDAQGNVKSADYVGMIPVMVKAIQQMQREIDDLKNQK